MFTPYTKAHGIDDLQFYFGNEEARDWYDPIKPYVRLEYEWVKAHVPLAGEYVLDGGAHHGHYSILFKDAAALVCVEPIPENCMILAKNLALNDLLNARIVRGALSGLRSTVIWESQNIECYPPAEIMPKATIVKLDIEGSEYKVFPLAFLTMPKVHTWIVECHPHAGNPDEIVRILWENGFEVWKVDRAQMQVVDYLAGSPWPTHDTLIGRKRDGNLDGPSR